ncbi:MAG: hypothetical protein KZQ99_15790 [Candidatus Thiodiazotropha sp. (ex Dulcina madagascariensis)]|nr:hypothetical protein [Candidatus Thiodiazotropha sp. (ex Dulcina madagascariensis)]
MHNYDGLLRNITMILLTMIMVSLSVTTLGAVIESPLLALFWYLALIGIVMLMLISVVLAVILVIRRMAKRYRQMMMRRAGEAVDQQPGGDRKPAVGEISPEGVLPGGS